MDGDPQNPDRTEQVVVDVTEERPPRPERDDRGPRHARDNRGNRDHRGGREARGNRGDRGNRGPRDDRDLVEAGIVLCFAEMKVPTKDHLKRYGLYDKIGHEHFVPTLDQAVAKYLERIGDHAINLAEMVVFMVRGKDIRHLGSAGNGGARPHGVLFLCVHNVARSQMAEAWATKLFPVGVRIWSAGSAPASVDPRTVHVMQEVGIDISSARPKSIKEIPLGHVDTVVTLCADEHCPAVAGDLIRQSWSLQDPGLPAYPFHSPMVMFKSFRPLSPTKGSPWSWLCRWATLMAA